ncbi:MAG: hypothetical protein HKN48_08320 [Flavobacteriaceae bacterium]|nr:hypothetical protein [Flavobacteriaceae bacterium]
MKKLIFVFLFLVSTLYSNAQETKDPLLQEVQLGIEMEIGHPESSTYNYIEFPRPNFIIKRGGIANFNRVPGTKVVVVAFKEKKDGTRWVRLKRADGKRFFGSHPSVMADLNKALSSGELQSI